MEEKINVALDREDIICLVKGTSPSYALMDLPLMQKLGSFVGGHYDRWDWNFQFPDDVSSSTLYELYKELKKCG